MDTSAIIFYISHISLLMHHHLKDAKVTLTRKTMVTGVLIIIKKVH